MHSVTVDRDKNRLLIVLEGHISKEEASEVVTEIAQVVVELSRGFDVISDLSGFSFGSVAGAQSLTHAMELLAIRGVRRVVRIAGKSRPGLTQFMRLTAKFNKYKPVIVKTMEEAEIVLRHE